ncbi:MAG: glycosyltransferase [Weeksellaceae bacterium]
MKLSIIIPVYNAAAFLENNFCKLEQVYSLLNNHEFEIIYVNDGSTDNSGDILEEIANNKSNIVILHQENQGSSGARNTGIDIAKGEYIQFLDSDDYIDWDQIIPLLDTAKLKQLDAISYRLDYVTLEGEKISNRPKQNVVHDQVISGVDAIISGFNPSSICVFLFNRAFLNRHQLRITPKITHMDVEFTSRLFMVAERIMFKDIIAYHYIQSEDSITRPKSIEKVHQLLKDEIIVADLVRNNKKQTTNNNLEKAIEKNYNSIVWGLIWRFYNQKNEVSFQFKKDCITELKRKDLYPIKGELKTKFQKITRIIFNQEWLLNLLIKN